MFKKSLFAALCAVSVAATSASAQTSTNRVAAETDWSVYQETNPKECWAVTAPRETVNTRGGKVVPVRRSQILLFVFHRPGASVKGQVAFTGGYPFAPGKSISMQVGSTTFDLATNGEWAWPATTEDDAKVVAAMRRGSSAVITAQSSRGTVTKDEFSLLGFTAAAAKASELCAS